MNYDNLCINLFPCRSVMKQVSSDIAHLKKCSLCRVLHLCHQRLLWGSLTPEILLLLWTTDTEDWPWKPLLTSEKRFHNDLSPALPGDLPGLGNPLPCLCQLQGSQDQECQRVRQKIFAVH